MKDINPHSKIDGYPNYVIVMKFANKTNDGQNYLMAMYS
jgi:hypothetical protein